MNSTYYFNIKRDQIFSFFTKKILVQDIKPLLPATLATPTNFLSVKNHLLIALIYLHTRDRTEVKVCLCVCVCVSECVV